MARAVVGIRDLKNDLSRWVARARRGTEVLVTDRGAPVARLVPLRGADPLEALIEAGVIEPAPRGAPRRQPRTRGHLPGDRPSMADSVPPQRRGAPPSAHPAAG